MLAHINKLERLEEYKNAFTFYCDQLNKGVFDAISYVDNSGFDLGDLKKIAEKKGVSNKVEFISYKSDLSPTYQWAYLELNLISYFISRTTLSITNKNTIIWKLTGRYTILNVSSIIKKCSSQRKEIYFNYRNYPQRWIDLYFFGFSYEPFKKIFLDNLETYRDTEPGEIVLRKYLDNNLNQLSV
jgi:hypothetical protein